MLHARKDYQRIQDPLTKDSKDSGNGKGIPKDEPVFLLRAHDELFVPMLEHYAVLARFAGCSPTMVQMVRQHVETAKLYQIAHPPKTPDC